MKPSFIPACSTANSHTTPALEVEPWQAHHHTSSLVHRQNEAAGMLLDTLWSGPSPRKPAGVFQSSFWALPAGGLAKKLNAAPRFPGRSFLVLFSVPLHLLPRCVCLLGSNFHVVSGSYFWVNMYFSKRKPHSTQWDFWVNMPRKCF